MRSAADLVGAPINHDEAQSWVGRVLLILLFAGLAGVNMLNVALNFAEGEILNSLQDFATNRATGAKGEN